MATKDDDEWGADTGVEDRPLPRAKTSPGEYRENRGAPRTASTSANAAFREIRELGRKLDEHSSQDRTALAAINSKLEDQGETLIQLRIDSGATTAAMQTMTSELRHRRDIHKIEVEGEITGRVEKQKMERERMSNQTKVWLALIGVLTAAITVVITELVS
jgi:hypothetical protein